MHLIPLSMLAAALMAAAAPSPEPAEITIKVDLNSDNDAAGNVHPPLENPRVDITDGHGGDGPNLSDRPYNLHYNFTLWSRVISTPRVLPKGCAKPPYKETIVGYPSGVQFAEFGIESNFTLCRGKVLYDNSVFTVGPDRNPIYVYLGPSDRAQVFRTEKVIGRGREPDRLYLRFTDPTLWFASLDCAPSKGDRLAALSGPEGKGSLILLSFPFFSFLFFSSLFFSFLSVCPYPYADNDLC